MEHRPILNLGRMEPLLQGPHRAGLRDLAATDRDAGALAIPVGLRAQDEELEGIGMEPAMLDIDADQFRPPERPGIA